MRNPVKLYTDPQICPKIPADTDMKKTWYVWYRFFDICSQQEVLIKKKAGINYFNTFKERLEEATALKEALQAGLDKGWNPVTKTFMVVEKDADPLQEFNELSSMPFDKAIPFAITKCEVAPRTLKNYTNSSKRIMTQAGRVVITGYDKIFDFSQVPIGEVKKKHVRFLLDHCKKTFHWTNKAYNKHMGYFKSVLTRLVDCDVIGANPALGIKYLPVMETKKFIPYTQAEKKIISEYFFLQHYGYFILLMMIYYAGMRPNEVLALKVCDVDLGKRIITIIPDAHRDNSKTKSIREIPIMESLYLLLREWLKDLTDPGYYIFGSPYPAGRGYRGSGPNGTRGVMHPDYFKPSVTRIKRDTITRFWKAIVIDKLKINKYQYAAKHTGGDDKILAGISMDALKQLYGHSSKFMTEKYVSVLRQIHNQEIRALSPQF
jgi:integrase